MKKQFLVLIISLVAFSGHGQNSFIEKFAEADLAFNSQEENKYEEAAKRAAIKTNTQPEVIAFKNQLNEDLQELRESQFETEFDTLTVTFTVSKIYGAKAVVYTHSNHHYEIPIIPRINPFKTILQEGKDYNMQITYNREIREEKHCSGCSGIVPAGLIWMSITPEQAKKDALILRELSSTPEIGYTRSPRFQ